MINVTLTDAESVFDSEVLPDSLGLDAERFDVHVYEAGTHEQLTARMRDAEIILCNRARIGAAEMNAAPRLRMIAVFATGYDKIDIAAARERGIAVCNVPGYSTEAVAQHTLALMLALVDRITEAADAPVGESALSRLPLPRFCLGGKTLGIIGLGAIGRRVAQLASAFGMRVYAAEHLGTATAVGSSTESVVTSAVGSDDAEHGARAAADRAAETVSRTVGAAETLTPPVGNIETAIPTVGACERDGGISRLPLPQLLAESDIVSLHCPLTEQSRHIINVDTVANMKDGSMLINTARGALVDENALAAALHSGKLAGAAADVTEIEPTPSDCPLRTAPNCILTPHVAWACSDARRVLMAEVRENIEAFLRGERRNRVD